MRLRYIDRNTTAQYLHHAGKVWRRVWWRLWWRV